MGNVGPLELIVVLIIALIVLGPKRLPEVGRSVGKGMREFKDALSGQDEHQAEAIPPTPVNESGDETNAGSDPTHSSTR